MVDYLEMEDGVKLFIKKDMVKAPQANLVINHGFAEHCDRYDHVAREFNKRNISVYRYDLRGHGRSSSEKGHIDSFDEFIGDLDFIVDRILKKSPDKPLFMLGHSMGGLITCIYGIKYGYKLRGQIFSGAAVLRANQSKGLKGSLLKLVSRLFPNIKIRNNLSNEVCSDEEVVEDYMEDPMILTHATANFLREFQIEATEYVEEDISSYRCPCLITHGEKDSIISKDASIFLYNNIGSEKKDIKIYDKLYHEILNEEEQGLIIEDMTDWIYELLEV